MIFWKGSTDQDETLTGQLLKLSQWYSLELDKKQAKTAGMYDEFDNATKSFNNSEIEFYQKRAKDYYSSNSGNMDAATIERFQLLDDRYEFQKQKNADYLVQKERGYDFSNKILDLADKYSSADDMMSFEWETSSFNSKVK